MIKCKECKYWKKPNEYDEIATPIDQDTYKPMVLPFEVRICESENITLFERNPNSNGVSLRDGSDFHCAMYTGEDYGCINGCRLTYNEPDTTESLILAR